MSRNKLSLKELVLEYNVMAKKVGKLPVRKFSDKKSALSRVSKLSKIVAKTAPKTITGGDRPKQQLNKAPKLSQRKFRSGTLRAEALKLLLEKKGATREELNTTISSYYEEHGKSSAKVVLRVRELLHIIHDYLGYGLKEKNGRIVAYTNG